MALRFDRSLSLLELIGYGSPRNSLVVIRHFEGLVGRRADFNCYSRYSFYHYEEE
jgi:hypothetical protein